MRNLRGNVRSNNFLFVTLLILGTYVGFAQNGTPMTDTSPNSIPVPTKLVKVTGQVFEVQPEGRKPCLPGKVCWWDLVVEIGWNSEWNLLTTFKPDLKKDQFVAVTAKVTASNRKFMTQAEIDAKLPRIISFKVVDPATDADARESKRRIDEQVSASGIDFKVLSSSGSVANPVRASTKEKSGAASAPTRKGHSTSISYANFYVQARTGDLIVGERYIFSAGVNDMGTSSIFLHNPNYPNGPQMQLQATAAFDSQDDYRAYLGIDTVGPSTVIASVGTGGTILIHKVL
jgi:hypothetical protein